MKYTVSGTFHKIRSTLMKYFHLTLVFKFHCVRFASIKKIVFTKKRYLVNLIVLTSVSYSQSKNKKKIKNTKTYLNETIFDSQERQKVTTVTN